MHVICSYCGKYIKEKKPFEITKKTHGICLECFMPLMSQNKGLSYDEYLETFEHPVVAIDCRQRIAAANEAALTMMQRPLERVKGLLGGEALECRYSRLPEGCGGTIHCETCTIRNLVIRTAADQNSHYNELITMETETGKVSLLVSTVYHEGLVQIVFEKCPADEE